MCILCVIQKWSRRIATMLPWLVIPLIGLWALSQLLPPAFRFEITSPRVACVFVLLVTLFWYEVLMPQLSAWRVRRKALLMERKRLEAIEMQKLKKTATRCCRNCLTPYRDQNPGGGRYMCSYCGHSSKRPVLDMPMPPELGLSNSGIFNDLVGRGDKMFNGKGWSENRQKHMQEWSENGTWSNRSSCMRSSFWRKNRVGVFVGDENCLAEKSYSDGVVFACRLLASFFLSIRWLFRFSSSIDESSSDVDERGLLAKRGENGTHYHESRVEKARRKAEEKRQARLEKELLEEEDRKQREEVARLVEERRKLRDERIEAEKCCKSSPAAKEKNRKKENERKRQDIRKERNKAYSRSNSDSEEFDKSAGKETEQKHELNKNYHQEHKRHLSENFRVHNTEKRLGNGTENNNIMTSTGGRYFDRMKGTFLSSSTALTGGSFFGKKVTPVTLAKENKPLSSTDHSHSFARVRDISPPQFVAGRAVMSAEERNTNRPVVSEPQLKPEPRKSWHQLFVRSSSVSASANTSVISRPSTKPQAAIQSSQFPGQMSSIRTFDNPISFGLPSPLTEPTYSSGSTTSSLGFSPATAPVLSKVGEDSRDFLPEETEHFEYPCYVPDPISLLGPVSESLELRSEFAADTGLEKRHGLRNVSSSEVNKPSSIESPLTKLRIAGEKHFNDGTWQMWKSPLVQDGLGLVGGSASWLLPPDTARSSKGDFVHRVPQNRTMSLFTNEDSMLHDVYSPQTGHVENKKRNGTFSPVIGPSNHVTWSQNGFPPVLSGRESHFSLRLQEEGAHNDVAFGFGPSI